MGLHYYHIMLDFCEMNSVFEGIFWVLLFGKYFFVGFSVSGKVFFGSFRNTYSPPKRLEGNESPVFVDISGCVAAVAHGNLNSEVEHSLLVFFLVLSPCFPPNFS